MVSSSKIQTFHVLSSYFIYLTYVVEHLGMSHAWLELKLDIHEAHAKLQFACIFQAT